MADTDQHVRSLAATVGRRVQCQVHPEAGQPVADDDLCPKRLVVAADLLNQQVEDAPYGQFLAGDEADRAEVGEPAELREPEAEVGAAGGGSGVFQKLDACGHREPLVRVRHRGRVEPDSSHQGRRIPSQGTHQIGVVGQNRGAGERVHSKRPPERRPNCRQRLSQLS
nr:hypothetical protein [Streptomyces platensis]